MIISGRIFWLSFFTVAGATQALSATLTPEAGEVLVSTGGGYQVISAPTEVAPTDCVLVNPGGLAKLQLDDGSVMMIEPGQSVCVGEAVGQAAGGGEAAAAGAPGALGGSTLLVGGLAVAGAAGLIAAVASGGSSGSSVPASP